MLNKPAQIAVFSSHNNKTSHITSLDHAYSTYILLYIYGQSRGMTSRFNWRQYGESTPASYISGNIAKSQINILKSKIYTLYTLKMSINNTNTHNTSQSLSSENIF